MTHPPQDDEEAIERARTITRRTDDQSWDRASISELEIRRMEAQWKSDVDLKLDELIQAERVRAAKYDAFLDMLLIREAKRLRFQEAIIEKGVIALLGTGVVAVLTLLWVGVKAQLAESFRR